VIRVRLRRGPGGDVDGRAGEDPEEARELHFGLLVLFFFGLERVKWLLSCRGWSSPGCCCTESGETSGCS
jgi:hypothetical protein